MAHRLILPSFQFPRNVSKEDKAHSASALLKLFLHFLGTAVALPLFTKLFKLSDYMIMLAAFVDKILCNLIMAFSGTVVGFYVGSSQQI